MVTMATLLLLLAPLTSQHAIFLEPPSRATLPRLRPACGLAHNYDESQLYCGGATAQHGAANMGRCGICGDPWAGPHPHQAGGKFATGTIARSYRVGQLIDVEVDLRAHHLVSLCRLCRLAKH